VAARFVLVYVLEPAASLDLVSTWLSACWFASEFWVFFVAAWLTSTVIPIEIPTVKAIKAKQDNTSGSFMFSVKLLWRNCDILFVMKLEFLWFDLFCLVLFLFSFLLNLLIL